LALAAVVATGYSLGQTRGQPERAPGRERMQVPHKRIYVDAKRGNDEWNGTKQSPRQSISAVIADLPDPLTYSVTVEVAGGRYETVWAHKMPTYSLELMRSMRPGVLVKIVGKPDAEGRPPTLAWDGKTTMIDVREGEWWFENLWIATYSTRQRRGIDDAPEESFCGIIATDHGLVRFREREGASLELGNGSLSASYYGVIRLGCETARITSWGEQSNNLAINNGGRIDLHSTTVTLRAKQRRNTPIGLEHDGHILGEGAHVIIEGENSMAIALQKASTFTCNDIELRGKFDYCLWASSGSMFVGRFLSDVGRIEATTGANINIEKIDGRLIGPVIAKHAARISLPDRDVLPE